MPKVVKRAGIIYPLEPLPEERSAVSKERQEALLKLIGIWKTLQPPSDEEVDRILDQERMRKYS